MGDDNMDSKQFAWSSVMGSYGGEYNFVNSPTATQSQTPGADDLNDSQVSSMAEAAMAAAAMAAAAAASRNGAGAGGAGGESESGLVLPLKRKYEEIDSPTSSSTSSSSPLSGYPMQSIPFNTLGNYGTSFGFSSGGPFLPSGQALSRPGQGQMEYQNYLSQAQMSHASNQPQRYQYYSNSPSDEALQPPTKRHASSLSTTSPSGYDTSMAPPPSPPPGLSNSGSSVSSGATSPSSMAAAAAAAAILARNKQTNYWDKIEEIARANYECSTIEEHRGKSLVQLQRSQANSELLTILNIDETWQYFALNQDVDWSRLTDKERQTKINNIRKSVLRALQKKNFQTIQHSAYGKGSYSIFRRTLPPPLPDSALQSSSSSSSSSSALPSLSHPHAGSDAFSFDTPSITSSMFDVNAMQSLFSMQSVRISNLEHTLQDRQLADISACDLVALLLPSVNQIKIGQNKIFQQLSSISSLVSKIRTSLHSPTGLVAVPVIESTDPATLYIENLPQGITMRLNNEVALWGCPNLQLQLWIERSVSVSSDGFSPNVHSSSSSNPFVFPCSLDYLDNNQAVIVHNANWNSLEVSEGDTVCLLLRYYNVATNTFRIPVVSSSSSRSHSDLISQISCAYLP